MQLFDISNKKGLAVQSIMLGKSRMGGIKTSEECVKLLKSGMGDSLGLSLNDLFWLCYCYDVTLWLAMWEQQNKCSEPPTFFKFICNAVKGEDRAEVSSGVKDFFFFEKEEVCFFFKKAF